MKITEKFMGFQILLLQFREALYFLKESFHFIRETFWLEIR